jgi:hypothetical protein
VTAVHHRDQRYRRWAATVRHEAAINPLSVCWRCGLTIGEHERRNPGRLITWTAGHTLDGSLTWLPWLNVERQPPEGGDYLAPEVSICNYSNGASYGNGRRTNPTSRTW